MDLQCRENIAANELTGGFVNGFKFVEYTL